MDFPFSFLSTLVGIIAHDKTIRSCRVHSWNIDMAITPGTVKASISGVNRRRLRPAGKRAISIGDCTDPGD
jgi:hypothetical protein